MSHTKLIGEEKLGEQSAVSAYAKYIFGVRICDYWQGKFWQIAHDSPAKIFLHTV